MTQIIVFSFNRALQLDALLSSIQRHWSKTEHQLAVLYNTSNDEYQAGYDMLKQKYPKCLFVKETVGKHRYPYREYLSFFNLTKLIKYKHCRWQKSDFKRLLTEIVCQTTCKQIMFLTDDSLFIRDVEISNDILNWIEKKPEQNSFSLRLGYEVNKPLKKLPESTNGCITWNYSDYKEYKNWGYPFSVDGHIYSKKFVKPLLRKIVFNNPSTLEAHLYDYSAKHHLLNHGKAYTAPSLLSYPINMVQTVADNESLSISTKELNDYFLNGYSLDYPIPELITAFQQYPNELSLHKGCKNVTIRTLD